MTKKHNKQNHTTPPLAYHIDVLVGEDGEITKAALIAWMEHFNLTTERFAELLPVSKRTVDNWRSNSNSYTFPLYLRRALRDLEREIGEDFH